MVQKKGHIAAVKYHLFGLITVVGIVSALWCQSFVSLADSTGKVKVDSAVIRKEANTGSEAIGSASRGNTVTIRDEVQDSSGTLWYQVYVNGNTTGYIRSDLVDKQDGDSGSQSSTGQDAAQPESSASGASIDPGTLIDPQYAAVSTGTAIVRTAPSTNDAVVDRLTRDTQVVVSGQSDGSDGKLWYYVTFTGTNGAERTGYIRSDLLSLGDMVPVPEEETPEPQETVPEPAEPVNNDYELTYEQSSDGSYVWYLHDYTSGTNQSDKYLVSQLMEATRVRSENDAADAKTLVRQRIAIVVLIVLIVLLIAAVVIMALKLRDVYYEDYEDEDEEEEASAQRGNRAEETEKEASTQRRRRTEEEASTQRRRRAEEEEPTQRRRRTMEPEKSSERRRRRAEEEDAQARRRRRMEEEETEEDSASVKTASKRKTKNFLLDDDEFEFEFLSMDDKNL